MRYTSSIPLVAQAVSKVMIAWMSGHPIMLDMGIVVIVAAAILVAVRLQWFVERPMTTGFRRLVSYLSSVVERQERSDLEICAPPRQRKSPPSSAPVGSVPEGGGSRAGEWM